MDIAGAAAVDALTEAAVAAVTPAPLSRAVAGDESGETNFGALCNRQTPSSCLLAVRNGPCDADCKRNFTVIIFPMIALLLGGHCAANDARHPLPLHADAAGARRPARRPRLRGGPRPLVDVAPPVGAPEPAQHLLLCVPRAAHL
eukprot:TRINITY_DN20170_c0_g1_i1.p1 TRINITY_DN20170_c0_g1~~TRINITY_DN20170_c0_g1_i1.p1  ORF type:complete len:145 (+),score=31.18 TRINITY_DN20170_c0_g1_i1:194-628(+)